MATPSLGRKPEKPGKADAQQDGRTARPATRTTKFKESPERPNEETLRPNGRPVLETDHPKLEFGPVSVPGRSHLFNRWPHAGLG